MCTHVLFKLTQIINGMAIVPSCASFVSSSRKEKIAISAISAIAQSVPHDLVINMNNILCSLGSLICHCWE